ncbi:MAG TPA: hypothetical protein RMH99_26735 [Sandaracinaceae bacterium LLY-WYZ-13_1]|nr:hypothetical protein [Sandaracinaceae bacterium LLY-WYZ-13_1]
MSSPARHAYTLRDYLEVEEMSEVRHEYLDGEIYAMAGGAPEHAAFARQSSAPCRPACAGPPVAPTLRTFGCACQRPA